MYAGLIVGDLCWQHFWQSWKVSPLFGLPTQFLCAFLFSADKKHSNSAAFRQFQRQLFHTSLACILSSLRTGMTEPESALCGDGKYCHVIYRLGPYIANYPEQVLIACIVQNWCARYEHTHNQLLDYWCWARCTARKDDLESLGVDCTEDHLSTIQDVLDLGELWSTYGIVGDVEVRLSWAVLLRPNWFALVIAIHTYLSSHQYSWVTFPRPPPSTYQGHFQRPLSRVGMRVHQAEAS